MNRVVKQIIYGFGYLTFFGLASFFIYLGFYHMPPSCFDNNLNQGEVGVDCGGPCFPCELKGVEIQHSPIAIFDVGGDKVTFLTQLQNPSETYGVSLLYRFDVFGDFGERIETINGRVTLKGGELDYVVSPGIKVGIEDINRVILKIIDTHWYIDEVVPVYDIALENIKTVVADDARVVGRIVNRESLLFSTARITALLKDEYNRVVHASIVELINIAPLGGRDFVIFFPSIEFLEEFNIQHTHVSVEVFAE